MTAQCIHQAGDPASAVAESDDYRVELKLEKGPKGPAHDGELVRACMHPCMRSDPAGLMKILGASTRGGESTNGGGVELKVTW